MSCAGAFTSRIISEMRGGGGAVVCFFSSFCNQMLQMSFFK